MTVTAPRGFVASGISCGIKASGRRDLALVASADGRPVPAAATFTQNLAAAAPVQVSRAHLAATGGYAAGVVLSSGNANAATGEAGVAHAERMCSLVAAGLACAGEELDAAHILVCQTGLIGIPLPMERIEPAIACLVDSRGPGRDAAAQAAEAIMTTDTVRKEALFEGDGFTVGAMAKGAAMLAPNMATMLAVLTTDARCEPGRLSRALGKAVDHTFNRLSVDGCTSTNDTVVVLANGRSGVEPAEHALAEALFEVCGELAEAMARDAEGATKLCRVSVTGAATDAEAHQAARKVAESQLVQCSLNGADPYWGRVVSELGSAGVRFELGRVQVCYGGTAVCRGGVAVAHDEAYVARHMAGRLIELECDLGLGSGTAAVLTTDLSCAYIDENRTTS